MAGHLFIIVQEDITQEGGHVEIASLSSSGFIRPRYHQHNRKYRAAYSLIRIWIPSSMLFCLMATSAFDSHRPELGMPCNPMNHMKFAS